ncbi:MAG: thioesterase family protein [Candidatus Omnitrophica bacterium]|nr:thioesterase family protein [Candidatus Omnitrophota bacterium]
MDKFSYDVRVRYAETDRMGVSYYANYLVWFEVARTEYFRALGVNYTEFEKRGIFLPVLSVQCSYFAPTTYDDLLTITTCVNSLKRTSLSFQYRVTRKADGVVVVEGSTVHAFTDSSFKPIRIPDEVLNVVKVALL